MTQENKLGIGWSFPPSFKSSVAGPQMAMEEMLIEQAISILLNTLFGERPLHQEYGSRLSDFGFNSIDVAVLADLKEEIANAIMLNEPRVTLKEIKFDSVHIYDGILKIELEYHINATNRPGNMVFPYYLENS